MEVMNIKECMGYATDILKAAEIEAPVFEAGVILCYVLKCSKVFLYSHDDYKLNEIQLGELKNLLEQRAKNTPLQYLTGQAGFMSLTFSVSPAVLIPRQDTEILVEKCIDLVKEKLEETTGLRETGNKADNWVKVLDMCTGSGCIAVSMASYCPECGLVACDISSDALKVAEINRDRNHVKDRVELRRGNLFEVLKAGEFFDIIVSNPPYIETDTIAQLQKEVRNYEPGMALDGGRDGLDFYRAITAAAPGYLKERGYLAFEIGYNQSERVCELMRRDFDHIEVIKDLGGNDRVVIGRLQNK